MIGSALNSANVIIVAVHSIHTVDNDL